MRLGFHYHIPFHQDSDGQISTPGYLGRFLDSIATEVDQLTCFMHSAAASEIQYSDYMLQAANIRWIDLGPKASVPNRNLFAHRYTRLLREHLAELDVLLIRGPSPLLPAMAKATSTLPVTLLLVGDYLAGINDLPQPWWRKEAIRAWSFWNYRQQFNVAKRSLTFVNSHKLYEQLQPHVPDLIETRTTTLSVTDFYERDDTCQSKPIRLLYTGRMDRAKGLFEMVEAVDMLLKQGHDIILDLVGWPAKGDTIVDELLQNVIAHGLEGRVIYHGFKSVGPELFAYYRQADIYLIASQNSEGFPRTIWEAMAHSLPVVATKVGSIQAFLGDSTALLVAPSNSSELATAIRRIIVEPALRSKVITQGLKLARENTLEGRAHELITGIKAWIVENA